MSTALRLAVLSTGRQDWGILRSTCKLAAASTQMDLCLIAGGMALAVEHGRAVEQMEADGHIPIRISFGDLTAPSFVQAARATEAVGTTLDAHRADALLLVGDRFETLAAATAATLARVPLVHVHGGEETIGAFDNAIRHAITKLAHLHFVSHHDHARRVVEMGEDPAAVHVVGAPGLDNLWREDLPGRVSLERRLGIGLEPPVVIVTLHPATLGAAPEVEVRAVVDAMDAVAATYVVTLPNNDPGAASIRDTLAKATRDRSRRVAVESLGERYFWSLMKNADAMLGNSSSALIEAPALGLPAVNVGERQRGRLRGSNVVDVPPSSADVVAALKRVLAPRYRRSISGGALFGDGRSGARIVSILENWQVPRPPVKRHHSPI